MTTAVTFVFRCTTTNATVEVMSRTMRNAMRMASLKAGCKTVNLEFVCIRENEPKLYPAA